MDKITLLEPLSYVCPGTAGLSDTPTALTYRGLAGTVCFDKTTGKITVDPPTTDVLQLHLELQQLVTTRTRQNAFSCCVSSRSSVLRAMAWLR